jgi:hypothetical protein
MLSPAEIRALCERKYPAFLRSVLTGERFFPLKVAIVRPTSTDDFRKLDAEITTLDKGNLGYRIDWEFINTRRYGRQRFPQRVWFDSEAQFLQALGRGAEFEQFRGLLQYTRQHCPELMGWLPANVLRLIEWGPVWPQLLLVCRYFIANPRPARYARELPIAVDTKFIERHQGILRQLLDFVLPQEAKSDSSIFEVRFGLRSEEPRVHLRILDSGLQADVSLPFDDLSVPLSQFVAQRIFEKTTVVIVENKKTFLTLPVMTNTLAIFGGGGAAELLTTVLWLSSCRLIYWGDLDVHGFHILSRLRRAFPALLSVMMDRETLMRFETECVVARPATYEAVSHLTDSERAAYEIVGTRRLLLEQEKIPYAYGGEQMRRACITDISAAQRRAGTGQPDGRCAG